MNPLAAFANDPVRRVVALLYHDVFDDRSEVRSPERYDISVTAFRRHLHSLTKATRAAVPVGSPALPVHSRVLLTFDDARTSAYNRVADLLEESGWKGHFFVPTRFLSDSAHLTRTQVRDLAGRGHVIGSHSWSHPARMSRLSIRRLMEEWVRSTSELSQIIGQPIRTASVPGGDYSIEIARAAHEANISWLFTSEPTARVRRAAGCGVLGRFTVTGTTSESTIVALARGDASAHLEAWCGWKVRQVGKRTVRAFHGLAPTSLCKAKKCSS